MLRKGIEEPMRAKSVSLRSSPDIAALKIIEGHLCNFPLLTSFAIGIDSLLSRNGNVV